MKHLFVPYEIALILKQKGFNEDCIYYWYPNEDRNKPHILVLGDNVQPNQYKNIRQLYKEGYYTLTTPAPLYQQVIDWLDSKGILIAAHYTPFQGHWVYNILDLNKIEGEVNFRSFGKALVTGLGDNTAPSRTEALTQAINHALTLI